MAIRRVMRLDMDVGEVQTLDMAGAYLCTALKASLFSTTIQSTRSAASSVEPMGQPSFQ
jgi:hypothetical protein